jgi:hypothetical protein
MSRTTKLIAAAVLVVVAIGGFWTKVLTPKRDERDAARAQVASAEAAATAARETLVAYRRAEAAYPANYATITHLGKAVPGDDDVRSLVVQVQAAAKASRVDFRSIEANGGGPTATDTAATGAAKTPPGSQLVGSAGFAAMPLTLVFSGDYPHLTQLFTRLESFVRLDDAQIEVRGRLLHVDSIEMQPATDGGKLVTATVSASAYIVPEAAIPAAASAAPTTPTTAGGPTAADSSATTGALR